MIIEVDLTHGTPSVKLIDPDDCKRFHLAVRSGDVAALSAVLQEHGLGASMPSGDVMISVAAVKRLAQGRVEAGWDERLCAMVGYAEGKGWFDRTTGSLQPHVEWQ